MVRWAFTHFGFDVYGGTGFEDASIENGNQL